MANKKINVFVHYYEHYPYLMSGLNIRDKENVVKLDDGPVVALYKTTAGKTEVSAKRHYSLSIFEMREHVLPEKMYMYELKHYSHETIHKRR